MVLFIIALSLAGLSLILFFLAVPPHFAENRTSRRLSMVGSTLGVITGIGFIGIASVPADVNKTVHRLFVYVAFTGFLFVVFCYSAAILKSRMYIGGHMPTPTLPSRSSWRSIWRCCSAGRT